MITTSASPLPREIDNPQFNEFIADQIVKSMPAILILLPPRPPDQELDFHKWGVVGCRWILDEGVKALMGLSPEQSEAPPFELRELRGHDSAWYSPNGFTVDTVLEHCREEIVKWLHRLCFRSMSNNRLPVFSVFRQIYGEISGKPVSRIVASQSPRVKDMSVILRSISLQKMPFNLQHCLMDEIRHSEPIMFHTSGKRLRFVKLSKDRIMNPFRSPAKLGLQDVTGLFTDKNPFHEYACSVLDVFKAETTGLIEPRMTSANRKKDLLFQHRFMAAEKLSGKGENRAFQIELFPLRDGKYRFRLKRSMGSKPFLMQVCRACSCCAVERGQPKCPKATYVLWDLKKYPIDVVFEKIVRPEDEFVLDSWLGTWEQIVFKAECRHKSILRHPFVSNRGKMLSTGMYSGAICLEKTAYRILSENSQHTEGLNPVFLLLQLLKAAARIMRYGLLKRDERVPLHNNFCKVLNPTAIYQSVIIGEDNADSVAAQLGAEKINYIR